MGFQNRVEPSACEDCVHCNCSEEFVYQCREIFTGILFREIGIQDSWSQDSNGGVHVHKMDHRVEASIQQGDVRIDKTNIFPLALLYPDVVCFREPEIHAITDQTDTGEVFLQYFYGSVGRPIVDNDYLVSKTGRLFFDGFEAFH